MDTKQTANLVPNRSRVRITHVDMYGYLGRERHPQASDVGLELTVTSVQHDIDMGEDPGGDYAVVTGVTDGGRVLELIDEEIEESV